MNELTIMVKIRVPKETGWVKDDIMHWGRDKLVPRFERTLDEYLVPLDLCEFALSVSEVDDD